jgi:GNAT superfamily N-acetyltransferase
MVSGIEIRWCDDPRDAEELGRFFAANLSREYISHSELMGLRALAPGVWSEDIVRILTDDFAARCGQGHGTPPPGGETKHALAARLDCELIGIAMLTFSSGGRTPFGIIEDIVVSRKARGRHLGAQMMEWILDAFARAGLTRAFLESGGQNDEAHRFFARWGFEAVSVTMMAELAGADRAPKPDS